MQLLTITGNNVLALGNQPCLHLKYHSKYNCYASIPTSMGIVKVIYMVNNIPVLALLGLLRWHFKVGTNLRPVLKERGARGWDERMQGGSKTQNELRIVTELQLSQTALPHCEAFNQE